MTHEMKFVNGTWICPTCGRHIAIYPTMRILVPGDKSTMHKGSVGGVSINVDEYDPGIEKLFRTYEGR